MSNSLETRIRWTIAAFRKLLTQARAEGWGPPGEDRAPIEVDLPDDDPLEILRARLGLDSFATDALWLLACCDLEPALARMAHALGTPELPDLDVASWMRLVEIATGHALSTKMIERLDRLGLIETTWDPRLPTARRWVRASDRVVELARGELTLDREVVDGRIVPPDEIAARSRDLPPPFDNAFERGALLVAVGAEGSGRATLLGHVAARRGRGTLRIFSRELALEDARLTRRCRAIAREARLFELCVMVEELGAIPEPARSIVERELFANLDGAILATASEELRWAGRRPVASHRIAIPDRRDRAAIWRDFLGASSEELIEAATDAYAISPGTIASAVQTAIAIAGKEPAVTMQSIHEGLRAHLDQQVGSFATRTTCTQTWRDLVLPSDQMAQIVEMVARVRQRRTVLDTWGFGRKVGRGLGIAALLSGPPGTGKTMVAGLVANELGLDLYQVDLSKLVSKYIGETEKNLGAVFDAAESGHAIILFDEADSLFSKRTEVKSSNDRYANLEVNYLLQRIEQFTGISMLTTNHDTAIDPAFRRRMAIHVRFGMPDECQREELWRAMIPTEAPLAPQIDFVELARDYALTGGYIKNAVLRAAYLASDEGTAITGDHLHRAARIETEGMGKIVRHAS